MNCTNREENEEKKKPTFPWLLSVVFDAENDTFVPSGRVSGLRTVKCLCSVLSRHKPGIRYPQLL